MAKAVISDKAYGQVKSAKSESFGIFKAIFKPITTSIKSVDHATKSIKSKSYPLSSISYPQVNVKVTEVLPFRVKFTTIGIDSYGPGNPAPIGIAVIGINNYIL
jgi:hypothetical protein